jgi:Transcriptional regulators
MKTEKIKMSDIAKALNVSTISVSRALAGQEGVSEELRGRILLKASEMGYFKPRNLSDHKILVLHQKPFIQDNSNYSFKIQGIEKALQAAGCEYDVEFVDKDSQSQEKPSLPNKMQKGARYDGLLFIGRFESGYVRFVTQRIKHYVVYAGYSPDGSYDGVWYNFNNGGYLQCEYLIGKGHRRIGFLGNTGGYVGKEKLLGIRSALEDHCLPVEEAFFQCVEDDFKEKVRSMICEKGLTAVICQWDYTAIQLIQFLHEHGIRVPDDFSVVGSGNTEMSSLCIPALTTMELHIDYACELAVDLLRRRFLRPEKPAENILINSTMVERDSVRPLEV